MKEIGENKEKNFVSVVIHVHNNQDEITNYLQNLVGILDKNFEKYEIICVDDNSSDLSIEVLKNTSKILKIKSLTLISMSVFQGVELIMTAGVDLSIGDFVFEFDSLMLDYPLDTIMRVYHRSLEGFDIVSASPNKNVSFSSRLFYYLFNQFSFSRNKIKTERFRILSRRAINRIHSLSKTIPYRKALYANSGLKCDNVEFNSDYKKYSKHKQYRRELAIDTLILFTSIGYRFSISLSLLLLSFTLFAVLYTLVMFFTLDKPVEGWTTMMLLLSVGLSGLFMILSIIIKYLSLLVDLVFKKQRYLIESVERISN